jgi:hypothetical protein
MPITYRIDTQRGRILTTCAGNVTLPQVMAHFDALQRDPDCPRRPDVLLDVTEINSLAGPAQMRAAADRVGRIEDIVFGACAIVASPGPLLEMAQTFESFARGSFASIRTFSQRKEAERWLRDYGDGA